MSRSKRGEGTQEEVQRDEEVDHYITYIPIYLWRWLCLGLAGHQPIVEEQVDWKIVIPATTRLEANNERTSARKKEEVRGLHT